MTQRSANTVNRWSTGQASLPLQHLRGPGLLGGALGLHQAIKGVSLGGVGSGVSPTTALAVSLKVDQDALPMELVQQIKAGQVNLNDPAITLALLKLNAIIGLTGFFKSDGMLRSVGIQCALCHSAMDNAFSPGIGHRLDGWTNRDLNVGVIIALSPNLQPVADVLEVDVPTVKAVLNSWGQENLMPNCSDS